MAGVYISYPFCAQKCSFCNFASGVFARGLERRYLDALANELRAFLWPWTPETVYLGGGTPGRLDGDALAALLALVPGRPWKEATIEAAPGTITPHSADAWRRAGIDRLSLGVQSFVARELVRTGRRHNADTVSGEVRLLRECGIDNFNIDLICGLPFQTAGSWEESLDWIERLEAPHVSVYMLEVDEDSRLGAEILSHGGRYGAAETPSDDLTADLYLRAIDRLERAGIRQYEISNFARPGRESLHNLKYWRLEPYAGFGADAHSYDGRVRRRNPEAPEDYIARGAVEAVAASPEERYFVGLRLRAGVALAAAAWAQYGPRLRRQFDAGLLERDGDTLRLTPRGILLSNEVFQEFLA